ncbi:MAG: hypothetical protein WC712_03435 [Candidatus Brocadiia bacterium]
MRTKLLLTFAVVALLTAPAFGTAALKVTKGKVLAVRAGQTIELIAGSEVLPGDKLTSSEPSEVQIQGGILTLLKDSSTVVSSGGTSISLLSGAVRITGAHPSTYVTCGDRRIHLIAGDMLIRALREAKGTTTEVVVMKGSAILARNISATPSALSADGAMPAPDSTECSTLSEAEYCAIDPVGNVSGKKLTIESPEVNTAVTGLPPTPGSDQKIEGVVFCTGGTGKARVSRVDFDGFLKDGDIITVAEGDSQVLTLPDGATVKVTGLATVRFLYTEIGGKKYPLIFVDNGKVEVTVTGSPVVVQNATCKVLVQSGVLEFQSLPKSTKVKQITGFSRVWLTASLRKDKIRAIGLIKANYGDKQESLDNDTNPSEDNPSDFELSGDSGVLFDTTPPAPLPQSPPELPVPPPPTEPKGPDRSDVSPH